jgi:hypothetical protein
MIATIATKRAGGAFLLLVMAAACNAATSTPVAPVAPVAPASGASGPVVASGSATPLASDASAPASASASAPPPAHPCDLGVWDQQANACGVPPRGATGDPGAWAGCSQASAPQNARCFTGTHWVKARCACACDGTTSWNDARRRCE